MDNYKRYLTDGDYILLHQNLDFNAHSDESIHKMMENLDNFMKYHIDRKYEIIHLAHAFEFYLKGLFLKNNINIYNKQSKTKFASELLTDLNQNLLPDVKNIEEFKQTLKELTSYRGMIIHSIDTKELPGPNLIKKWVQYVLIVRTELKK